MSSRGDSVPAAAALPCPRFHHQPPLRTYRVRGARQCRPGSARAQRRRRRTPPPATDCSLRGCRGSRLAGPAANSLISLNRNIIKTRRSSNWMPCLPNTGDKDRFRGNRTDISEDKILSQPNSATFRGKNLRFSQEETIKEDTDAWGRLIRARSFQATMGRPAVVG